MLVQLFARWFSKEPPPKLNAHPNKTLGILLTLAGQQVLSMPLAWSSLKYERRAGCQLSNSPCQIQSAQQIIADLKRDFMYCLQTLKHNK